VRSSWHSHLPHSPITVHHAPEDISCLQDRHIVIDNSSSGTDSISGALSSRDDKCVPGSTTTYPAEVPLESSTHVEARCVRGKNTLRIMNNRPSHSNALISEETMCYQCTQPQIRCVWLDSWFYIHGRFFPGFVRHSMPRVESHLNAESVAVHQAAGDIAILRIDVDM